MKLLTSICTVFLLFTISSCGSQEPFVPDTYEEEFITFGNGGGITGAVTQFYILKDGRTYKKISSDSLSFMGKMDKKVCQQQFSGLEKWGMKEMKINDPGNRYFFLDSNTGNNRLTWGGNHEKAPDILIAFHANLSRLVKDLNTNKN